MNHYAADVENDDDNNNNINMEEEDKEEGKSLGTTTTTPQEVKQKKEEDALSCAQHASEILITIIQNSQLDSPVMISLTRNPALKRIIDLIIHPRTTAAATTTIRDMAEKEEEVFSPHESIMTCAIMVLESIVLQLGGYGAVATNTTKTLDDNGDTSIMVGQNNAQVTTEEQSFINNENGTLTPSAKQSATQVGRPSLVTIADTSTLLEYIPTLLTRLSSLLTHPSTKSWMLPVQFISSGNNNNSHSQQQEQQQQQSSREILGMSRLRIIRLIEALVLLGDSAIDKALLHNNENENDCVLEKCLELFWTFEWNSMLHQSIANLLVHVFEGGEGRMGLQMYFLGRCNLLGRLMESFDECGGGGSSENDDISCSNEADDAAVVGAAVDTSSSNRERSQVGDGSKIEDISDNVDVDDDADAVVPVSEDDVDSAMEKESQEQRKDSGDDDGLSDPSESGDLVTINSSACASSSSPQERLPPPSSRTSFRKGYMGHIIIICQALVHSCNATTLGTAGDADNNCGDDIDIDEPGSSPLKSPESMDEIGTSSCFETSAIQAAAHTIDDSSSSTMSNSKKRKGQSPARDGSEDIKRLACPSPTSGSESDLFSSPASPIPKVPSVAQSSEECDDGAECYQPNNGPQGKTLLSIETMLQQHPLYNKWQHFISTVLASEISVQSTPLGGQQAVDPTNSGYESSMMPSVINDNSDSDFLGIDQNGPLGCAGVLGGLIVGEIDMDENDLDIAASMMEALSLPTSNGHGGGPSNPAGHSRRRGVSLLGGGESEKGTAGTIGNFGSVIEQPGGFKDYVYDDPLGGIHPFGSAESSDEDDKNADCDSSNGSEEDGFMADAMVVSRDGGIKQQDGSGNNKKSTATTAQSSGLNDSSTDESEEDDDDDDDDNGDENDDDDVPVMDLFAGHFEPDFANFASFDDNANGDNQFGSDAKDDEKQNDEAGHDIFSATPFDLVDSLSDAETEIPSKPP